VSHIDVKQARESFERDGVVHLPGALAGEWVDLLAIGIKRNLLHLGPYGRRLYEGTDREMIMDHSNFRVIPEYQILVRDSPITELVASILGSEQLWLFFDQIWVKEAGTSRRTPWHQDTTSWVAEGNHVCGFWMAVERQQAHESLEFVRGSHKGPLYAGTSFDAYDETKPYYPEAEWPRLPDIEADRGAWDIVSFPNEPGDAVLFHPSTLHGGGAGTNGRSTLSLRFFGDDVVYSPRPGRPSPPCPGVAELHQQGDPLRSAWFPQVLPKPAQGQW
jgi:ectoine hydroxylase-related dioxygenase (phytanoyl-CoA dioxygenase family)